MFNGDLCIFRRAEHVQETQKLTAKIDNLNRELTSSKAKTKEAQKIISDRDDRIGDLESELSKSISNGQRLKKELDETNTEFQKQSQTQNEVVIDMEKRIQLEESKCNKMHYQREKWKRKAQELDAALTDVQTRLTSFEERNSTLVQNLNHATMQLQDLRSQQAFQQSVSRAGIYHTPEVSSDIGTWFREYLTISFVFL
jgi:chromosome segregation ATPase